MTSPAPKHLLVVSHVLTHPAGQGNRARVKAFCDEAQRRGWAVHFLLYDMFAAGLAEREADGIAAMREQWETVEVVKADASSMSPASRVRRRLMRSPRYLRAAKRGWPLPVNWRVDDFACPRLLEATARLAKEHEVDTVLAQYIFLSRCLESAPAGVPKLIDTHDRFTRRNNKLIAAGVAPSWMSVGRSEEKKALERADALIAIQREEAEAFRELCSTRVFEVTHVQPLASERTDYGALRSVGAIGSWNPLNLASFRAFLDEAARAGLTEHARIKIAGSVCDGLAPAPEGVELLGRVDTLGEFYNAIDLAVNPSITGTGLKIKTVEAFAHGVPVVSTTSGSEGIAGVQPYHKLPDLRAVVQHLVRLAESGESLAPYHKHSLDCYDLYAASNRAQLDDLFDYLNSRG